ncbi:MAG TPA: hypothetical protein VKB26_04460 [Candidatus Acidoferrales bacterium]|nr:hypothetical protein [Candidatus Acidoferrales bacterium]
MSDLRTFARIAALATLVLWCVASVGAMQQKPAPSVNQAPPAHKPVRPAPGGAHTHAVVHTAKKTAAMKPAMKPTSKRAPAHSMVAKKPAQAPKPAPAAVTPAVSSPAALANQTPVVLEASHGRDPFAALIRPTDPNAGRTNLPPGIGGLQVATLRLQGMVKTSDGMVAVVANPQDSVYFLHDGDRIFDGVVEKIGIDDIMFRQESKDAFGRTIDRDVSKRLYPIAGDEQ